MTQEQQSAEEVRSSIAAEVFSDGAGAEPPTGADSGGEASAASSSQVDEGTQQPNDEAKPDPIEDLRQRFTQFEQRMGAIDKIGERLTQAERRIGGITNELGAAKKVAQSTTGPAPTAAQMQTAAKDPAEWESLKEDFPDWAKGIEAKMAVDRAAIMQQIKAEIQANGSAQQDPAAAERVTRLESELSFVRTDMAISRKHPNWMQTISAPEFVEWQKANGNADSDDPAVVVTILDKFEESRKHKPTRQIREERQQRLDESHTPQQGRRPAPSKSEEEMTDKELRASIAKQVWAPSA